MLGVVMKLSDGPTLGLSLRLELGIVLGFNDCDVEVADDEKLL